jgi:hypothetical protein
MKVLFLAASLLWGFGPPDAVYPGELTRADINFFFSSASFDGKTWFYQLSPNTRGMLWRVIDGKRDVTGSCQSGQRLSVARGASLEIKNKAVDLNIFPYDRHQRAVLVFSADPSHGVPQEERSVLFSWGSGEIIPYFSSRLKTIIF